MKALLLATALTALSPLGAYAQTSDELAKGATDTGNVLNYGMGTTSSATAHSPRSTGRR